MGTFKRAGILGVGNMGGALLEGLTTESGSTFEPVIYDADDELLRKRLEDYPVDAAKSVPDLVGSTDFVVVCVKPKDLETALEDLGTTTVSLVSIAAGVPIERLQSLLPEDASVIRVMPNTPAQLGEGMSFVAPGPSVPKPFLRAARNVFESVGEVAVVEEEALDAATALSGSGPAYVFYFLEAIREAGIYLGLEKSHANRGAVQTFLGSSKLASRDERSPSELRDAVSSPGGTTVEALRTLDKYGVKGKIKEAVIAACKKAGEDLSDLH